MNYEWVQKEVEQFGKWEFNMVPFGLTQAPAYFQALISKVLEGLSHICNCIFR